ncbi:MAG: aspartate/glutamate racemase family protein [Pyrinomonadaceae bacterium]
MKTLGLIGGIGPESTIEYYRLLVAGYRARTGGGPYPSIIINSVDLQRLIAWITANELGRITDYLVDEIGRLQSAGADFAALASNTPHIVFNEIQRRVKLPLISIVETACERVQALGFKTVGLFGTRFTMRARFYPEVFSRTDIKLVIPNEDEQTYIHERYMGELLNNIFRPETRARMLEIADELKARDGIEALILGGTELPLLLRDEEHNGVRLLDTTRIHVDHLVERLLEE